MCAFIGKYWDISCLVDEQYKTMTMCLLNISGSHLNTASPVLIFSTLGISRCCAVAMAYLMHHLKYTLKVMILLLLLELALMLSADASLKGQFTQKLKKFCHHLLTVELFQSQNNFNAPFFCKSLWIKASAK